MKCGEHPNHQLRLNRLICQIEFLTSVVYMCDFINVADKNHETHHKYA